MAKDDEFQRTNIRIESSTDLHKRLTFPKTQRHNVEDCLLSCSKTKSSFACLNVSTIEIKHGFNI